jgi:alpha-tubulin suppressor-like RCC1 family protein
MLGTGEFGDDELVPVPVVGLSEPITRISAGSDHTCAVTESGSVWCWGRNFYGQLGDGTDLENDCPDWDSCDTPVPVRVVGFGPEE